MKIPKEYVLVIIIGLFILAYVLEAIVDPLVVQLATPYAFLTPTYFSKFPFTAATVIIRGLAIFLTPLFLISFIPGAHFAKAGITLVISALAQLYALQEVASGTTLVPLEWSISLAAAGAALLLPTVLFVLGGMIHGAAGKFALPDVPESESLEDK